MTTVAVLPVKALDRAKQRLTEALSAGHRRALMEAMVSDTLTAVGRVAEISRILVVTSDQAASRIASGHGAAVVEDTAHSHSDAALLGIARAIELGAQRVLLAACDCPLIDPRELTALIEQPVPERSVLIVPDRHGEGTKALLLTPPGSLTPAFGDGSRQRHIDLALAEGTTPEVIEVPSLGLDIDTREDLDELMARFEATRGGAAHTRGMLSQLMRSNT